MSTSNNSFIQQNTVSDQGAGIGLAETFNISVLYNTIFNCSLGIQTSHDENFTLAYNTIENSSAYGIYLYYINNGTVIKNRIRDSTLFGIYVAYSEQNDIYLNEFLGNNAGGSQAEDESGLNNIFEMNYWDDWTSPDSNSDGFVDSLYDFIGNNDPLPLSMVHTLSVPVVLGPNGGETLSDFVQINWTASIDSYDFSITYTIYLSLDNGSSWIIIASTVEGTSYIWDTKEFTNSGECLLAVVAYNEKGAFSYDYTDQVFQISNIAHYLTLPIILQPIIGETMFGLYNIQWKTSVDTWNSSKAVTYAVYYALISDFIYVELVASIEATSLFWNTETVADDEYRLQIIATSEDGISSVVGQGPYTVNNANPPTTTSDITTTENTSEGTSTSLLTSETSIPSTPTSGWTIVPIFFSLIILYIKKKK